MTQRTASVLAQAKINLFLRILAREASGYHQLETLLCRIDLADRVTVATGTKDSGLSISGPALPANGLGPTEQNLAWRAAIAYQLATGWPTGFQITIEKHICVGGGLGGGSADAGAVLRLLNALAPEPLDASRLIEVAGTLGADVPFLTQDVSPLALAWGRGDQLLALPPLPSRGCALFTFPFGVSTSDAYAWLAAARPAPPPSSVRSPADLAYWEGVDELGVNDFEGVVVPRYAALQVAMTELARVAGLGQRPRLSGSGSSIFMLGPAQAHLPESLLAIETDTPQEVFPVATATSERVFPIEMVG